MKLLLSILILITLSASAQMKKLEGVWTSPTSSYYTTIMYSEEKNEFKVMNFSFAEDRVIHELVLKIEENHILTSLYNEDNNYSVNVTYELLNDNQILCVYEGDLNKRLALNRIVIEE
tara:strand:+ start:404 stop:757 length:354 start_codon:yes stop_codon:yes gene_type:complete